MREITPLTSPSPYNDEWRINTAAVEVLGRAIIAITRTVMFYRWDLVNGSYTDLDLGTGRTAPFMPLPLADSMR